MQTAQRVELQELPENGEGPAVFSKAQLGLIEGVKVELLVSIGKAHLTVKELFDMKASSTLKLDKLTDDPVEILLNGKLVARGTLVVVEDNFGVNITEIAKP